MKNLSLNGVWNVIYDDGNIGVTLGYQKKEVFMNNVYLSQQNVPSCLEEKKQDYEGVAWYLKTFVAPPEMENKCVRLHFGAVNFRSEVWVNNCPIGVHEGGYTPFEFEIGDVLKYGEENYITVRVITPIITKEIIIDGLQRDEAPHWRGAIGGGIWQDVELIANENEYFKDLFVRGNIHTGDIKMTGLVTNPSLATTTKTLSLDIIDFKTNEVLISYSEEFNSYCGDNDFDINVNLESFKCWSPDEPNLYIASIKIGDSDVQNVRFGFKEFSVHGNNFTLNGKPIYIKSAFCEGLYPNTLSYPDDPEMIKNEILLAKEAGINMLRPWRKPQLKEVYDFADEIGMMYISSPPIECMKHWPSLTPYLEKRIMNEIHEMIIRDRNHACIIIWELFNEIRRPELARYKHKASVMARKLDSTRPVIDESGGNSGGANIYLPNQSEPTPFNDIHIYSGAYMYDEAYNKITGFSKQVTTGLNSVVRQGLLSNVTEIGFGSPGMLTELVEKYTKEGNPKSPDYRNYHVLLKEYKRAFDNHGFDAIYSNVDEFFSDVEKLHAQANLLMTEAARVNDMVAGIGIHAFTDGDWVIGAGLLDVYRRPKAAYYSAQKIYQNQYIAIRTSYVNAYAGKPIDVYFTPVNDEDTITATLAYDVVDSNGSIVMQNEIDFRLEHGINNTITINLETNELCGLYEINAKIDSNDSVMCYNSYRICILQKNELNFDNIEVYSCYTDNSLVEYLKSLGVTVKPYKSGVKGIIFCGAKIGETLENGDFIIDKHTISAVADDVEKGAVAIYPEFDKYNMMREGMFFNQDTLLPFDLKMLYTRGSWTPFNRCIKEDCFTKGLPTNMMMDNLYHNIAPKTSLDINAGEWSVGGIGYDYEKDLHHNNYRGVAKPHAFADLVSRKYGKGTYVLSTLKLIENLDKDAFADTIMKNILKNFNK